MADQRLSMASTKAPESFAEIPDNPGARQQLGLKHSATQAVKLFAPLTLSMLFVVASMSTITNDVKQQQPTTNQLSFEAAKNLWPSLTNVIIIVSIVVALTFLFYKLYKNECHKLLQSWLCMASFTLFFVLNYFYVSSLLSAFNMAMDYATILLFLWNFGVLGILALHWHGPLRLQQSYHIFVSAMIALTLEKILNEWATYLLLALLSAWDLIAVLAPKGPLRSLVAIARQRDEEMLPTLIYTATVVYGFMALTGNEVNEAADNLPLNNLKRHRNGDSIIESIEAEQGSQNESEDFFEIQLGLGDFIFFSLLVGKVSALKDWNLTIACFIMLLFGLFLTLTLLKLCQKALPALPLSIALALIYHLSAKFLIKSNLEIL